MKFMIYFLFLLGIFKGLNSVEFFKAMTDLENLEKYVRLYMKEKSPKSSLTHLITCYIREGAYTDAEWIIAGGSIPDDLPQYIKEKDLSEGTNAQLCKTYREIVLPNKEKIDFVHFFAVINGIEFSNSYFGDIAHLVGWGGDVFQLLQDIKNQQGSLEELMEIAKQNYFLIKGGLDAADFVSDLDAPIILKKKNDNNNFVDIIKDYYNNKEYLDRINSFINLTFPSLKNKNKFREEIFKIYNNDIYINILECKDDIREGSFKCLLPGNLKSQYIEHQKAAVYVFSDYLAENYNGFLN